VAWSQLSAGVLGQNVDAAVDLGLGVVEVGAHAHEAWSIVNDHPVFGEILDGSGRIIMMDHDDGGTVIRIWEAKAKASAFRTSDDSVG
jgi:hypothetical protein